jgi:hypothetical protein
MFCDKHTRTATDKSMAVVPFLMHFTWNKDLKLRAHIKGHELMPVKIKIQGGGTGSNQ